VEFVSGPHLDGLASYRRVDGQDPDQEGLSGCPGAVMLTLFKRAAAVLKHCR
jgi:hypothetical protein